MTTPDIEKLRERPIVPSKAPIRKSIVIECPACHETFQHQSVGSWRATDYKTEQPPAVREEDPSAS